MQTTSSCYLWARMLQQSAAYKPNKHICIQVFTTASIWMLLKGFASNLGQGSKTNKSIKNTSIIQRMNVLLCLHWSVIYLCTTVLINSSTFTFISATVKNIYILYRCLDIFIHCKNTSTLYNIVQKLLVIFPLVPTVQSAYLQGVRYGQN